MDRRTACKLWILPLALPQSACWRSDAAFEPEYGKREWAQPPEEHSFAAHPLHNPALLHAVYTPLMVYLNDACRELDSAALEIVQ